jgi:hypothetical protein
MSGNSLVSVDLPDGGELLVPLGEELVQHPTADGRWFEVRWAQDDEGRLVVLDCQQVAAPLLNEAPTGEAGGRKASSDNPKQQHQ